MQLNHELATPRFYAVYLFSFVNSTLSSRPSLS